jgi:hypothetical protein
LLQVFISAAALAWSLAYLWPPCALPRRERISGDELLGMGFCDLVHRESAARRGQLEDAGMSDVETIITLLALLAVGAYAYALVGRWKS